MMRQLVGVAIAALSFPSFAQAQSLPPPLVYLRDIDPTIAQDIRYATSNNFTGNRLPGYDAPECVLTRDAALALKAVQADLAASGLSLKVYDCYRPERAVRAMAKWSHDGRDAGPTRRFFPNTDKSRLFALGYIAGYSKHSAGVAIDLTLIPKDATPAAFDPAARYGACTEPAGLRAPDNSLDMGTGYDCLDPKGHTNAAVTSEQRKNRMTLVAAMRKRGFANYFREWWHFSFPGAAAHHDVPIRPR